MTAQAEHETGGSNRRVGRVLTTLIVTNAADEVRADTGAIPVGEIRRLAMTDVLVDTGAMSLCLPVELVQRLGLPLQRKVAVIRATGVEELELYEYARLEIEGRSGIFECVALPSGSAALLGVVPMEVLGLEPDLKNRRLRLLPEAGRDTHYFAMSPIIY